MTVPPPFPLPRHYRLHFAQGVSSLSKASRAWRGGAEAGILGPREPASPAEGRHPAIWQQRPCSLTCCLSLGEGSLCRSRRKRPDKAAHPSQHKRNRNPHSGNLREAAQEPAEPSGPGLESTGLQSLLRQTLAGVCPLQPVSLSQRAKGTASILASDGSPESRATEAASQPARVEGLPSVSTPCKSPERL